MPDQDLDKILGVVSELVRRHNVRASDNIENLLTLQNKLATYSYYLAEEAGAAKKAFLSSKVARSIAVRKSVVEYILAGMPVTRAEVNAENDCEELYSAEALAEGKAAALKFHVDYLKEVLASIRQHISYLKEEKFNTRNQNNT